jgi:hypothetical protein
MRSEKYFGLLNKWCKTKNLWGAKCKIYKGISEKIKISGDVLHPVTHEQHRPCPHSSK